MRYLFSVMMATVIALLMLINIYQARTITGQQILIREMVANPSCMVGR